MKLQTLKKQDRLPEIAKGHESHQLKSMRILPSEVLAGLHHAEF